MCFNQKTGALALLLSSVCATSSFAQVGIGIGSYEDLNFGWSQNDPGTTREPISDFTGGPDNGLTFNPRIVADNNVLLGSADADSPDGDFDGLEGTSNAEIFMLPSITLDNGITIGANLEVEGFGSSTAGAEAELDEANVFVRGSFGTIRLGEEDDYTTTNIRLPDNSGFSACGNRQSDGVRYFTPRFFGFSASTGYVTDISDRHRGALASDIGGVFINPAVDFEYRLDGFEYDLSAGFCVDTGRILPTQFSVGLEGSNLSGTGEVANLNFPNLGVTGVGGIPGVLVNSPTDVQWGLLDVERASHLLALNFSQPLRINANGVVEELVATPSGSFWRPSGPSIGILSLVGGVRLGQDYQTERVNIMADTPAFGGNSGWMADSQTRFRTNRYGAYVGLSGSRIFPGLNGATNTLRLTGTLGYDYYDISVRDSVNGMGLGLGTFYNNTMTHSYDDGLLSATLTGSYNWTRDNQTFGLSVGVDYGGAAEYNYNRPDSNLLGALNPTLSLKRGLQANIGANWGIKW